MKLSAINLTLKFMPFTNEFVMLATRFSIGLFLFLFSSLVVGDPLSITEKKYFQRTSFYTFVGETTFRGVPVSIFVLPAISL